MEKRLTYSERMDNDRRDFLKYSLRMVLGGIAGITFFGAGANSFLNSEFVRRWAEKKNEDLNRKSYVKLKKLVCSEEEIVPVPKRGWQFYSQREINENSWLKDYTNVRELGDFYQVFNGGKGPSLVGKIRKPIFRNPGTGVCE